LPYQEQRAGAQLHPYFAVTSHRPFANNPSMPKLTAKQIKDALPAVPQWRRKARVIARTYEFKDFPAAIRFVNAVARVAEKAWHHPDIDIRWNKVTLALTTHDEGGLTGKDFALAEKFDRLE
jgi:4a-hydroxytetrahydrobiopterin dehydratase